ncbi:hypothetical protein N431DRAFT_472449 [Stipitochalara longipes BDJ]|nr:hypothetical protein N431DRAFT_472449 [Stipitochalara longipes BDJ]
MGPNQYALSRLLLVATVLAGILLQPVAAGTDYWCNEAFNPYPTLDCQRAWLEVLLKQKGCDGRAWIPAGAITKTYGTCEIQVYALNGEGVAIDPSLVGSSFAQLTARCRNGGFEWTDSATPLGGSISDTNTVPPIKRDIDSSNYTVGTSPSPLTHPSFSPKRKPSRHDTLQARTTTNLKEYPTKLIAKRNCVYNGPGTVVTAVLGHWSVVRVAWTFVPNLAAGDAPTSFLQDFLNSGTSGMSALYGQNNNNFLVFDAVSLINGGVAAIGASGWALPTEDGYPTWQAISTIFSPNDINSAFFDMVEDAILNSWTMAVYEMIDSGHNVVFSVGISLLRGTADQFPTS